MQSLHDQQVPDNIEVILARASVDGGSSLNRRCVDCRAADIEWCSMAFGTLVCLACAGRHRSLGE